MCSLGPGGRGGISHDGRLILGITGPWSLVLVPNVSTNVNLMLVPVQKLAGVPRNWYQEPTIVVPVLTYSGTDSPLVLRKLVNNITAGLMRWENREYSEYNV